MPTTIGNRGSVSYDTPLIMDLSAFTKVVSSSAPISLQRVLRKVNDDAEPDMSKGGIFCRSKEELLDDISWIKSFVDDLDNDADLPPGLASIEGSNASKLVTATGNIAQSFFLDDKYPWGNINKSKFTFSDNVVRGTASLLRSIIHNLFDERTVKSGSPSLFNTVGLPVYYKLHSSYGIYPYVPGSSPISLLALQYHVNVARIVCDRLKMSGGKESVISIYHDALDDTSKGYGVYVNDPHAHMFISRARPVGESKPIPVWKKDYNNHSLVARSGTFGSNSALRNIFPVCAALNLPSTRMAQMMTAVFRDVLGLHVGGLFHSFDVLYNCVTAWGYQSMSLHVEDISGFDNSTGHGHLLGAQQVLRTVFDLNDSDMRYLAECDSLPVMTVGLFDRDAGDYSLLAKDGGVASGFQLTTVYGTLINLMTKFEIMIKLFGSFDKMIASCANFAKNTSNASWGFMIKGDDVILFWNKNRLKMSSALMFDGMSAIGYKTEVEPGPIFLMLYADPTKIVLGKDVSGCPTQFLDKRIISSHGIGTRRVGNRSIFVEHPLKDIRPARLSIMANCDDVTLHPHRASIQDKLISMLNRAEKNVKGGAQSPWTLSSLRRYNTSEKGVNDMIDYASSAGINDKFLMEYMRKFASFDAASSKVIIDDVDSLMVSKILDSMTLYSELDADKDDPVDDSNDHTSLMGHIIYDYSESMSAIKNRAQVINDHIHNISQYKPRI